MKINEAYIESLLERVSSLSMDDPHDRRQMATFLMQELVRPMSQRLIQAWKAPLILQRLLDSVFEAEEK